MSTLRNGMIFVAAVSAAASSGPAMAQSTSGALRSAQSNSVDMFARDRGSAVRERPHPDYEARGLPLGAFTLFPKLQADAEYTDNVYATETGALDDFIWRVKPAVSLESGWSRHRFEAHANAAISRYQDYDSENSEDWGVGASGMVDVTRSSNFSIGADYAQLTEPRTSSNTAVSSVDPIQYDTFVASAAATQVRGRVRLSARADYRSFDYEDGVAVGGGVIDQDSRDRTVTSLVARADYAVSPATAFFIEVSGNERDYDTGTLLAPARDSSGYEAIAGVNFELGAVSRGEIAAGYIKQDYDDSAYSGIDGFGARAKIEWFPSELTTVTLSGSRTVEDAGIVGSSGYLSSAVGLVVDHELLRNIILSGVLNYSTDEYNGVDRNDDRFSAAVGGTYLLNRNLGVSLTASHLEQSSDGLNSGASYDVNRLMLSLVSQF